MVACKCLFLTPNRNVFARKFAVKSERFLAVLREHVIFNESRFIKWVSFFERNCIMKWVIFFGSFWFWDFLLDNLKLKKNSDDVRWNVWTNIKKLYARKNIFKKMIWNMWFWSIYILVQILFFRGDCWGTALGRFNQVFFCFQFFDVNQPWQPTLLLSPPPPTALYNCFVTKKSLNNIPFRKLSLIWKEHSKTRKCFNKTCSFNKVLPNLYIVRIW